jgi:hypothetical protein
LVLRSGTVARTIRLWKLFRGEVERFWRSKAEKVQNAISGVLREIQKTRTLMSDGNEDSMEKEGKSSLIILCQRTWLHCVHALRLCRRLNFRTMD